MIWGYWFLDNIKTIKDLNKTTPEEYKELKTLCQEYIETKFYEAWKWNKKISTNHRTLYEKVLQKMQAIKRTHNESN